VDFTHGSILEVGGSRGTDRRAVVHDLDDRRAAGETSRLTVARRETLYRLALAAQVRHRHLVGHLERVAQYTALLSGALGDGGTPSQSLLVASCLHDIGKLGIPDRILDKPGPLSCAERGILERHTLIGHALLTGSDDELLELAATIALTHHEHVDGRGYPRGLAGSDIPLAGRMVAIADAFDAVTSDRAYRRRRSILEAADVLHLGRDRQFDDVMVDRFLEVLPEVAAIAEAGPGTQLPLHALIGLGPRHAGVDDPPELGRVRGSLNR
jgi:response regulator RpfG family c-di-GMP phosphodiesterase